MNDSLDLQIPRFNLPVTMILGLLFLGNAGCGKKLSLPTGNVETPEKVLKIRAFNECLELKSALEAFNFEYGYLPTLASGGPDRIFTTNSEDGVRFITILMGKKPASGRSDNVKNISFFEAPVAKDNRERIIYQEGTESIKALVDPWRSPFRVLLDGDYDEHVTLPDGREKISGTMVVYSFGPNGKDEEGRGDDIGFTSR